MSSTFDCIFDLVVLLAFGVDLREPPRKPVFDIIRGDESLEESHSVKAGTEHEKTAPESALSEPEHDEHHEHKFNNVPEQEIENLIDSLERS